MNIPKWLKLSISLSLPLAVGAVAGMGTSEAINTWYVYLNKPSFNPPNWLFGPVWTTLYILMGVSLYLVWSAPRSALQNKALMVFAAQLMLNFAWSFLFFYFKRMDWALLEIILLWSAIIYMIVLFRQIRPAAAWLNIPYLAWVSFASVLNGAYYFLN